MDLKGRKTIVFGGSSDIAQEFLNNINSTEEIVIISRNNIKHNRSNIRVLKVDDYYHLEDVINQIEIKNKSISVANFAGSINLKPLHLAKDDEMYEILEVNLMTNFRILTSLLKIDMQSLSYVCFSSAAANYGLPNHELISTAKSAVEGLIRSCAATYGYKKYRFNCIAPGLIDSKLSKRFISNEKSKELVAKMNPLKKIGKPSDITDCLKWLLSNNSDFVTGQTISIDGGLNNINSRILQ